MASHTKHLFCLTLLLTISIQVNARASQFFSKTSRPEEPSTNYNYNDNNAALTDRSKSLSSSSSFDSEFPSRAFDETQEYYKDVKNNVPDERRYDRNQQYGMSDTRFLENGRYFYDVEAERNRGQYEPTNGNDNGGGFGSWHGANYRNINGDQNSNQENQKRQDEYYDP